ncbi:MAG: T9SS type A sorting domain-containing protein [Bacteroidales bacterium]|nr:T9SS type A sorting domain-containing protein [Bacteroidales bacterium]
MEQNFNFKWLILGILLSVLAMPILNAQDRMVEVGRAYYSEYRLPVRTYYPYGWSRTYYDYSDINISDTIYKIAYNVYNDPNGLVRDHQSIFMKNTGFRQAQTSAYFDPVDSGFVEVFNDTVVWDSSGWKEFHLTQPFAINDSNICIAWESRDSAYGYNNVYVYSDYYSSASIYAYGSSFPTSGSYRSRYPQIRIYFRDVPELIAKLPTNIASNSVDVNGVILDSMGYKITEIGVEYSTDSGFTAGSGTKEVLGTTDIGEFTISVSSLSSETKYYYMLYAVNAYGTAYTEQESFFTGKDISLVAPGEDNWENFDDVVNGMQIPFSITNFGEKIDSGEDIYIKFEYPIGTVVIDDTVSLNDDLVIGDTMELMTNSMVYFETVGQHDFLGIVSYPGDIQNANDSLFGWIKLIDGEFTFEDAIDKVIEVDTFPYYIRPSFTWQPDWPGSANYYWVTQGYNTRNLLVGEDGMYVLRVEVLNTYHYDTVYVKTPDVNPDANNIIYVTENGFGDGSSWSNSTSNLQKAMDHSSAEQVWVAKGTYYPSKLRYTTTDKRSIAFIISKEISLYGGFAGFESSPDQRNLSSNETILSGDINTPGDSTDNVYRVLEERNNVDKIIDGFTISGGYGWEYGAGAYLTNRAELSNCIIKNNVGYYGGGLYVTSNVQLHDNLIEHNMAYYQGGGVYVNGGRKIENCTVRYNKSRYSEGGGLTIYYHNYAVENLYIHDNYAPSYGGGIYKYSGSKLINSVISNNESGSYGGGIYCAYSDSISNCIIKGNKASSYGGGVYLRSSEVTRSMVVNNHASYGGGLYLDNSARVINSVVGNNTANTDGGGIYSNSSNYLYHTDVVNNYSPMSSGVVSGSGYLYIYNSIIWGMETDTSTPQVVFQNDNGNYIYSSGIADTGSIGFGSTTISKLYDLSMTNNSVMGPKFMFPTTFIGATEDPIQVSQIESSNWKLNLASICIDSANASFALGYDIDGTSRPQLFGDDIGAYEIKDAIYLVPPTGSDIDYGQTLSNSTLTGGKAYYKADTVSGTFAFMDGAMTPNAGNYSADVKFTPDVGVFDNSLTQVTIVVHKDTIDAYAINTKRYENQPNPPFELSYTGFKLSDDESVINTPPTATTTATIDSAAGAYPIQLSGGSDNNYVMILHDATLTVLAPDTFNITRPETKSIYYGQTISKSELTGGSVYDDLVEVTGKFEFTYPNVYLTNIGSNMTYFTFTPDDMITYAKITDTIYISVSKAQLTVRAQDLTKHQGEPNPEFLLVYQGFRFGDDISDIDVQPTVQTTADINSPYGYYPITLTGASDNKYNFNLINGTLTVLPPSNIDENEESSLKLYPNPVTYQLFIEHDNSKLLEYRVLSSTGVLVDIGTVSSDYIDFSSYPSGLYIVRINDMNFRVIKE